MAVSIKFLAFAASLLFFIISPSIQSSFRPKALVLPVSKDDSTLQYVTRIKQRTPRVPIKLVVDLGAQSLWVDCEKGYVSSSYKHARCHSAQCSLAKSKVCGICLNAGPKPGCNNNTCYIYYNNPVTRSSTIGEVAQDVVSVQSTNGKNPGKVVSVSNFLFTCSGHYIFRGLARGVKGMAGLGRTKISMASQFAAAFSFQRKFSICLSSSTSSNGVIFFGDGPYAFLPYNIDISKSLTHTPLILNPVSTATDSFKGEPSSDYFIGVKGININGKSVRLNTTLLSIDQEGGGGTRISTIIPYTVLEPSIYSAVVDAFVNEIPKVPRVPAVTPFETCFDAKSFGSTGVGLGVPHIDLVLQNNVIWRISSANSMVQVSKDVLCLGFVEGWYWSPIPSIIIGGHQIENNLLQFDLATSRLGFSSSLLFRQTSCSNFNFTSDV